MSDIASQVIVLIVIIGIIMLFALNPRTGITTVGMKMRQVISAPESLAEFIRMKPNRWKLNQYYSFSEENVLSLGHRYVGRFDGAVLHWEKAPILDIIIEYKFPVKQLPKQARKEDEFQSGLYALALLESGVSCSSTKLVTIYCLQNNARRCLNRKSMKDCWYCGDSKKFVTSFKPMSLLKILNRLDEVWYEGRKPRPIQEQSQCRVCPYNSRCNFSVV